MTDIAGDPRDLFVRAAQEFRVALRMDPAQRQAHLDAIAARDAALAVEVRSLLEHDSTTNDFLSTPVVMAPEGMMVGRYKIISTIGEGGMGTVFLAEQMEPVRRQVALKLIKLGMDSRAVVRRFQSERQVLARMEHPGIARILDGGVATDGRPYFVMELVRGVSITSWCDTHHLDTSARIALFLDVCAAVQHAHQKGVIHRDLKPSNLLVTDVDGRPTPRVIDFGIARALDEDFTANGTLTNVGRVAGTPEYMSPEQSGLMPTHDLDIRSDVYSLGVVLYELLTGTTPMRVRTRPGPARRPGSIQPRLRGNLDAIILKALEQEPQRRYSTVAALADDLVRHVNHQPVLARPAGAVYLATQFARRHTLGLVASTAMLVALITGLAFAVWGWQVSRQELFLSSVARGRLAGVAGDILEARQTLWRCYTEQPDSLQAAWALRELYFHQPCLWTVQHKGLRASTVKTLDANTVVVIEHGLPPYTMNVDTGAELMRCEVVPPDGRSHTPYRADISPDRTQVAVADGRGDVRVWSLVDGKYLGTIAVHGDGPSHVRYLNDSQHLLTGGADGRVQIVDTEHADSPVVLLHSDVAVRSLAVHNASGQLAAGYADGAVRHWANAQATPTDLKLHTKLVMCLEFDETGQRLASGSTDRRTGVWNTADGTNHLTLPSDDGTVRDLLYDSDGSLYILGWWRVERLAPDATKSVPVVSEGGWRMAMPRPGELILSNAHEPVLRRWRIDPASLFEPVPVEAGWRLRGVIGGDAPLLIGRRATLEGRTFEGETRWQHKFPSRVLAVAASADGERIAVATEDRSIWFRAGAAEVWSQLAQDFEPGSNDVLSVNPAGTRVAYAARGNAVSMISNDPPASAASSQFQSPRITQAFPPSPNEQLAVHFSRDGRTLLASERKELFRVLDLNSGERWEHPNKQSIFALDSTRNGTALLGTWTGPVWTADPRTGPQVALRGHTSLANCVAAHPTDPDLVLTGSMDGTIRLWHLGLHAELQSLSPFAGKPIGSVAFDASGVRVVATSSDGRAVTWPLYLGDQFIKGNSPSAQAVDPDLPRQPLHLD